MTPLKLMFDEDCCDFVPVGVDEGGQGDEDFPVFRSGDDYPASM